MHIAAYKIHNRQSSKQYHCRRAEPKLEVLPKAETIAGHSACFLGDYEVSDAAYQGEVPGDGRDPGKQDSGQLARALAVPALEREELIHDQNNQRDIAENVRANSYEYSKEEDTLHSVQIHVAAHKIKSQFREESVLKAGQPHKESHEQEDHGPVHLHHGVKGVFLVDYGVHQHGHA